MDHEAAQLEKQHVHDVYESTAPYFGDLQSKAWPRVRQFLQEQKPGSLIADIGKPGLCRVVGNIFYCTFPFQMRLHFWSNQKPETVCLACQYLD